jgi:hypothetical protein
MSRTVSYTAVVATILSGSAVLAQHAGQKEHQGSGGHGRAAGQEYTAQPNFTGPFNIAVHGAFQRMVQQKDYAAKVALKEILDARQTDAVGAASELRGEITAIDGKLLLTYGKPCPTCPAAEVEQATLLASAKVKAWQQPVVLPSDLAGSALDGFIMARAKQAGIDVTKPFPIRLKGTLVDVKMHVISAPNPAFKGHGHAPAHGAGGGHGGMALQDDISAKSIEGEVVGFYAPAHAQGVITHPGEPFHYHWVDLARTRTAHLDAFGMSKGASLLLPRP